MTTAFRILLLEVQCRRYEFLLVITLLFLRQTSCMINKNANAAAAAQSLFNGRPTVLITGSTDGIGLVTAKNMAQRGYNILLHGRDAQRLKSAMQTVQQFVQLTKPPPPLLQSPIINPQPTASCHVMTLPPTDLSTIQGCRNLAGHVRHICDSIIQTDNKNSTTIHLSVLLNNAGVYSEQLSITEDGLEQTFAVNVVAPFVLTSLLLPTMVGQCSGCRIVTASSISQSRSIQDWDDLPYYQKRRYSAHMSYAESKLCDAMLSTEFASRLVQRFRTDQITSNCLDPGTVNTKMLLTGWGPIGIPVDDALDETWLCSSDQIRGITGQYFVHRSPQQSNRYDPQERAKLWSLLSKLAPDAAEMWDYHWLS